MDATLESIVKGFAEQVGKSLDDVFDVIVQPQRIIILFTDDTYMTLHIQTND